jgi:hypothetical protein
MSRRVGESQSLPLILVFNYMMYPWTCVSRASRALHSASSVLSKYLLRRIRLTIGTGIANHRQISVNADLRYWYLSHEGGTRW